MNVTLSADQPAGEAGLTQTGKPPWGGKGGPGAERGSRSSRPGPRSVLMRSRRRPASTFFSSRDRGPRDEKLRGRGGCPARPRRLSRLPVGIRVNAPAPAASTWLLTPVSFAEGVGRGAERLRPASAGWRSAVRARPARAARSRSGAARSVRPAPPARCRPRCGGGAGLGEALLRGHRSHRCRVQTTVPQTKPARLECPAASGTLSRRYWRVVGIFTRKALIDVTSVLYTYDEPAARRRHRNQPLRR